MIQDSPDEKPIYRWPVIFMEFARIGATCFGGGSATVAAMRRLCLRRAWLSEREFMDTVVLSRLTPGISIIAQALLIGRAVCGPAGMLASLIGLLVPSIAITVILAWLYERVTLIPESSGALHSLVAITAGFAVAVCLQFLSDILRRGGMWRNAAIFAAYLAVSYMISSPLVLMGLAIILALVVPSLFAGDKGAGIEN